MKLNNESKRKNKVNKYRFIIQTLKEFVNSFLKHDKTVSWT